MRGDPWAVTVRDSGRLRLYLQTPSSLWYSSPMQEVSLAEAKNKLPELVDQALEGKEVLIKKDAHAKVKLIAVENSGKPQFGSAGGLIQISADFDAPLPDFQMYS